MRIRSKLTTIALAAGLVVGGFAGPARAADTTTTFILTAAGGLAVSAPTATALGEVATGTGTVSAQLGGITVSDPRGALAGSWGATVASTDFTTGAASADETIGKGLADYWSGAATASTGTAVRLPGQATALNKVTLGQSRTAFSATATIGNNTTTWNPTVIVNLPAAAVVGTYSGTITHSVA